MAASLMLPVGRLLVLRDVPKNELVRAIAILTWPALLAPIAAPLLAGVIVEHLTWHWIFLINVPIGFAGTLLAPRILPDIARDPATQFDTTGFALWAASACLLVGGLGEATSWSSGVLLTAAILFVTFACLLVRHLSRAASPLFALEPLSVDCH